MKTPEEAAVDYIAILNPDLTGIGIIPRDPQREYDFIQGVKWRDENPRPDPFTELLKRKLAEGYFDGDKRSSPGPDIGEGHISIPLAEFKVLRNRTRAYNEFINKNNKIKD